MGKMALSSNSSECEMLSVKNTKKEELKGRNKEQTFKSKGNAHFRMKHLMTLRILPVGSAAAYDLSSTVAVRESVTAPKVLLFCLTLRPTVPLGEDSDQGFISK